MASTLIKIKLINSSLKISKDKHYRYKEYEIPEDRKKDLIDYFFNRINILPKGYSKKKLEKAWLHVFNRMPDNSLRKIYLYKLILMNFVIGVDKT